MSSLLLKKRSKELELLDLGPAYYSNQEYTHCQKILYRINKLLGFFSFTKGFLKQFPANSSVLDVGCGGGLLLLNLSYCFPSMHFEGRDISPDAINMAEKGLKDNPRNNVCFKLQSQPKLDLQANSVDIILATLVCHHIEDDDLSVFFQDLLNISRKAVLINDLHRHIIPYLFYKLFSPLFGNRLINIDGLISIKRSFKRKELQQLLANAGIEKFSLKWRFPFCWSLILWKK